MASLRNLMGGKTKRTKTRGTKRFLGHEALESRQMLSITPVIDFDTYHFSADEGRRNAITAAITEITDRLEDTLKEIPAPTGENTWSATFRSPETGDQVSLDNRVIPANTIHLFIGTRELNGLSGQANAGSSSHGDQAWNDLVGGRGQAGAVASPKTDVSLWGGAIAYDPSVDWTNARFVKQLTQHEFGHLLGFGRGFNKTKPDGTTEYVPSTFENLSTEGASGGKFTGANVVAEFGGQPAVLNNGNGAHFDPSVTNEGRRVTMASTSNDTSDGYTKLDWAAFKDLGWQITEATVPNPTPVTTPGSTNQTIITGIELDKTAPPSGYAVRNTSQAVFNGKLYQALTDGDEKVSISFSTNNGGSFSAAVDTGQLARGNPSLVVNDNKLIMAWTGTDKHLNVAEVLVNPDGSFKELKNQEVLGYTSDHAMAIGSHNGTLVLAHSGTPGEELLLDVKQPGRTWGTVLTFTGEHTSDPPVLTEFANKMWVHWAGSSDASLIFLGRIQQGLQVLPVENGVLTVDGDQRGANYDDDFTIDKTASGGVKIVLNGETSEFAAGSVTSIVINTGGGNNSIHLLTAFSGIPITINGSGTDKLDFGTSVPTRTYTQGSNGLSSFGTINAGSQAINIRGLENVDGVAPDVSAVQLGAVSIDENGVASVTGTFLDPGTYSTHSVAINWGDGTSSPAVRLQLGNRTFTATHRYLDDNPTNTATDTYTISATITDNNNLNDSGSAAQTTANLKPVLTALSINASSTNNIKEGDPITITGSFTDVGTSDTHTVTVAWDDGTTTSATVTESNGSGTFTITHPITSGGIYTATVTVKDDDTGTATGTKTLFVTGVGVHQVGPYKALQVVGTNGSDIVTIDPQGKTNFSVKASFLMKKERIVPLAGINLIQVILRDGNDTAKVYSSITVPAVIDGGAGDDKLEGPKAGSVLIGGSGKDTLAAGAGRSLLIGGLGPDTLSGASGDDILIGGTTSFDFNIADDNKLANDLALLKMLQEWTSTRSLAERAQNIGNGSGPILGGTGLALKAGTTVFNDNDKDMLLGASGSDWFFFDSRDLMNDPKTDKRVLN
jgi:hypothetical protein